MELDLLQIAQNPDWKAMIYTIVKKEKMDPWNIDIVLLTRRFVEKIRTMKALNLRIPANAILAASILLRFKSDTLSILEEEEDVEDGDEEEQIQTEPVEAIGRIKYRGISLEELIKAVEIVIEREKKKRRKPPRIVPEQLFVFAEGEDFEQRTQQFFEKLKKLAGNDIITFDELLEKRTKDEVVDSLFCALHLANQEKIDMWQEEHFGTIFLKVRGV